ncbi:hypothetical protein [Vreelandella jeotgali]|uniref:hypothetical protein n=1 Tax=Vreelandella jeotgali TaxID=553386 RepID=UPI0003660C59|nr:hypothetical protein [Halomonas jeotgali]
MPRYLSALLLCALWLWSASGAVLAAPALSGEMIRDLKATGQSLDQGRHDRVARHAGRQAERLSSGNAADRYAAALYRHLAANALAGQAHYAAAAEQLAKARRQRGVGSREKHRWLREQARFHHAAGEHGKAIDRLGEWLNQSDGDSKQARWRLIGWLASEKRWQEAAMQLERVDRPTDERRRELSLAVNLRAGRTARALGLLTSGLSVNSPASDWRQAAGVAQRAGQPGVAAGLWDTAWRQGLLTRPADYWQLIALHLDGGTPARAGELMDAALANGRVVYSAMSLRLGATAWQQARDMPRALAAHRALARVSQRAEDWRLLGQLAYAWGEEASARSALERAVALGDDRAESWLAGL